MSVHYKFKSALEYDTVTFDGLHISVKDLKNAIIQQKRIGRSTDFDLQVTNAQTKEVYEDEDALIPKNTSLLIARIPLAAQTKPKTWEGYGGDSTPPTRLDEVGPIAKAVDLANLDASEDDKIRAMMSQSTQDYDPSNYVKIRGANQMGAVPPNYRCYKCHQSGHWIKDCPLSQGPEPMEIKKSTGIPRSFMVPVDSPQVPGAMMTPNGQYAVPVLDHLAYTQKQQPPPPVQEPKPEIPEDLLCSICSDLLTDAVMIPCCGNSFCDECIRSCLLESEEHECPDCHEKDISPGTLIPNRYLRNSVLNFKNNTGYTKRPMPRKQSTPPVASSTSQTPQQQEEKRPVSPVSPKPSKPESPKRVCKPDSGEKTVFSEADSTEPVKKIAAPDFSEDVDINEAAKLKRKESPSVAEGPPGVSPRESPKAHPISSNLSTRHQTAPRHSRRQSHDKSPRRHHHHSGRSPTYHDSSSRNEDRAGTPTVDEPGMGGNVVAPSAVYPPAGPQYTTAPPSGAIPPIMGLPQPPVLQGPPPVSGPYTGQPPPGVYPPTQGPPPNFRLPPPNQYSMPVGPYNVPPRPVFDTSRPPVGGHVPPYSSGYPGHRSSRNRDYSSSGRGMRGRTPPGIIDDPLEAFNRMLREKDERERRAKQRKGRSYSRSSSRSFSRSPVRRMRSRSPRRRGSRSRSRSFSISRSRSRTFSPGVKGSPYRDRDRDFSPRGGSPRRRAHSRYRSPIRSPPRYNRYKDGFGERARDRDYERERDRDFHRDNRGYSRERDYRERDRDGGADYHYYGGNDGRGRSKAQHWGQNAISRDGYYAPPPQDVQVPPPTYRYPPPQQQQQQQSRDSYNAPPYIPKNEMPSVHRRYEDVAPPGTEQPPVPGIEPSPPQDEKYQYPSPSREKETTRHEKERHHRYSHSPPPEKPIPSPRKSRDGERTRDRHETPDRHKKRRKEEEESDKEKHKKEQPDEDKLRKAREKKKKREKKEAERKKRKEKKEKREKKEEKEKDKEKKVKDDIKKVKISEEREQKPQQQISVDVSLDKKEKTPELEPEPERPVEDTKPDLYGDILTEGIDTEVVENYGKFEEHEDETIESPPKLEETELNKDEMETFKDYDDSEKDILELHTNEAELKTDLDKNEVLAPVPEKSKWEIDDDLTTITPTTPDSSKSDFKSDKTGKVTNEVLKRAENAIFAKAINAIRPIEIKKISGDRAKLYSGDRERKDSDEFPPHNIKVTIASKCENSERPPGAEPAKCVEVPADKPRLSVKERLGVKVDDLDRIVKVDRSYDRNKSCSLSPLSKRASEMTGYPLMDRRVEVDERKRHEDRGRSRYGNSRNYRPDSRRDHHDTHRDRDREIRRKDGSARKDEHRERRDSGHRTRESEARKEKRKRSLSRSDSADRKDRKRRRDKKQKKERGKKHHKKEEEEKNNMVSNKTEKSVEQLKPKPTTDRRKPTLDEASFEPDYDLETESEKEELKPKLVEKRSSSSGSESDKKDAKKKDSSSSDSSDSSSEEDRKRKKHKKHKKKKSRKDSSSSSSDSESESSEDEKERKRRKHKKKQKKRKKSKHK